MAGDTGAMRERLLRPFGRFGPAVAALSLCLIGAGGDTSRSGAVEVLSGPVPATVIEVMDGDTVKVRARIWLGQDLSTRVRLAGIDAPELNGGCARERALAERAPGRSWPGIWPRPTADRWRCGCSRCAMASMPAASWQGWKPSRPSIWARL